MHKVFKKTFSHFVWPALLQMLYVMGGPTCSVYASRIS